MKKLLLLLAVAAILAGCAKTPSGLKLPSLIGDNMLIQQKTDVAVWGKANRGVRIKVTPSWTKSVYVKTATDGNWKVTVPSPEAGGPYTLTVAASDTTVTINNVLCGDVWFCSGQSNMEMPMVGWPPTDTIMHSASTIAAADLPQVRLFILQKKVSGEPLDDCTGKWEICTPQTVGQFSATGFFFGRKLHQETKLPVGLIESSWGGTPSEAWTSADALAGAGEFADQLNAMKESNPLVDAYKAWLEGHKQQEIKATDDKWKNLDFGDRDASLPDFNDKSWPVIALPSLFETVTGDFDGAVWFRKDIELPESLAGKDLKLSLGPIDDMDCTWFNGEKVGSMEESGAWKLDRNYTVPGKLVRKGRNVIAVRVMDTGGGGGIYGKKGSMKLSAGKTAVDIEGEWKFQPVAELAGNKFYLYDLVNNDYSKQKRPVMIGAGSPSTLYNGMVYPARNYRIKGAIWYQGEANVGRAEQYAKIFPLMIRNWRETWDEGDFPFYFVQIAPYIYSGLDSTELAPLRESQKKALELPKTGMVVTTDVTTVMNIHPPFKKEVGERLADLALNNDYGINKPVNYPVLKNLVKDGKTVKVSFENIGTGLSAKDNKPAEFEIAGPDRIFVKAVAKLVNNELILEAPKVTDPVAVRYCWRNGSTATIFNSDGLPAEQFMADIK